jgi:hypothetical protein
MAVIKPTAGSWYIPIVLAGLSLLISAFVGYNKGDKDLVQRVSVLEAHQEDSTSRLGRIESKMDALTTAVMASLGSNSKSK